MRSAYENENAVLNEIEAHDMNSVAQFGNDLISPRGQMYLFCTAVYSVEMYTRVMRKSVEAMSGAEFISEQKSGNANKKMLAFVGEEASLLYMQGIAVDDHHLMARKLHHTNETQ